MTTLGARRMRLAGEDEARLKSPTARASNSPSCRRPPPSHGRDRCCTCRPCRRKEGPFRRAGRRPECSHHRRPGCPADYRRRRGWRLWVGGAFRSGRDAGAGHRRWRTRIARHARAPAGMPSSPSTGSTASSMPGGPAEEHMVHPGQLARYGAAKGARASASIRPYRMGMSCSSWLRTWKDGEATEIAILQLLQRFPEQHAADGSGCRRTRKNWLLGSRDRIPRASDRIGRDP